MTQDPPPAQSSSDWNAPNAASLHVASILLTVGYLLTAAGLLAFGAWKRFQIPQAPLIDPDIEGYLGPAVAALGGKPFMHLLGRSFPYPGFVYIVLRLFGDFRAIAVIQHVLGVAAGVVILLAWNAAGALVPPGGIPRPLFRWLGLVPAYICLGSSTGIAFEQMIRPEAIFPFLAILDIWLSFLFLKARFVDRNPSAPWLGALNVFVAFLVYMAKPSFGFATLFSTLPVWVSLFLPGAPAREKVLLTGASILPSLLILFLPEQILKKSDPWNGMFLPETLFSVHAPIILQQMNEDLAGTAPLSYPRPIIQAAHDLLAVELDKAAHITIPKTYPSLGFNPDYLMYEDSFCRRFPHQVHFDAKAMERFCMTYYLRALRHHPGVIASKVLRQLGLFYSARNPAYALGKAMDLSDMQYARVDRLMQSTSALGPNNPAVARYVATCNKLATESIVIPQARRFVEWLHFFSNNYLDLLAVALLSPALLLFPHPRAHFLLLVPALLLAYSYNFGNSLTIALVHSLEVARYVRIQLIFTVFAQCLSIYLILELAVYVARTRKLGSRAAH